MRRLLCLSSLLLAAAVCQAQEAKAPLTPAKTIALPNAPGGFNDYLTVDPEAHRLYAGYAAANALVVINTETNAISGQISDLPSVRGAAIVPSAGVGFCTIRGDKTIGVFQLSDLKVIQRLPGGDSPDSFLYNQPEKCVWIGSGTNGLVIDPEKKAVVATVKLGGKPEAAVADPNDGHIYQALEDKGEIIEVDTAARIVIRHFKLPEGLQPTGLAMDGARHRLFTAGKGGLFCVLNLDGKIVFSAKIGDNVDGVAYDAGLRRVYIPSGEGKLHVFQQTGADKYEALPDVPTFKSAARVAVDSQTHRVYVVGSAGDHAEIRAFDPVK